ncbi:MAG: D-alanyl-D-alanine carboxypeptidase family protein [Candidatus Binataceae bacterium]
MRARIDYGNYIQYLTKAAGAAIVSGALALMMPAPPAFAARRHPRSSAAHARNAAQDAVPAIPLSDIHVLGDRPAPFALDAKAAMLVDAATGTELYAYNEHVKMQPASLAKLMTFYLVLDALSSKRMTLDTPIPISEQAWRLSMDQSVSRMFLGVGQQVPVHDLLFGLMVSSGNDAAVALAEYLAGSTDAFTEQMNAKAKKIGLTETHFMNPDGLPVEGEYTTAADMVKLAESLLEHHPEAVTYTSAKEFTFDKIRQRNFNSLLFYDARVDGLKTGHVQAAGFHLVASANSQGMHLISAVLGTPSSEKRRTETEKLIDWAFRTYVTAKPSWHGVVPATLPVFYGAADTVAIAPVSQSEVTVERGQESKVTLQWNPSAKYLDAPIAKGAQVGTVALIVEGKAQDSITVVTQAAVARGGLFKRLRDHFRRK